MEKLIPVVNKLQDAFASLGQASPIDLPQIAVVGGQSAGKSSVLENFVGKDFLPRGAGIVTRRPLVLQLINQNGPEYGEFLHKPNIKMMDFLQIRAEIEAETDRVTGSNKNISPLPINLRIFSPHVLNLTIVDLPGLTKIAVGDQPKDIDQQIRKMVTDFISNPNCLVLAVTPANIDLANSDALLLAKEVDPQGLRTIGVITKIDLMDRGTNCRDVLLNVTYPLKRGYVGVVNRSQADIDTRKDIKDAQQAEYSYFVSNESYRDIANKCGTQHLQNVLNRQLTEHIRTTLPSLKKKLLEQMLSLENEIKGFSDDLDTQAGRARQLMTILQEFAQEMDQNLGFRISYVQTDHLSFGSKINKILTERFPYEIKKLKGSVDQTRHEIALSIQNSQGVRNTIFTPEAAFTTICRKKIDEIRPIALLIIDKIGEVMSEIIDYATTSKVGAFINLQDEIKLTCTRVLNDFISETKSQASRLIDYEYCHINTRHPDFIDLQEKNNTNYNSNPDDDKQTGIVVNAQNNTVFRKGYLGLPTSGLLKSSKDAWFVIKGENIICYKDETEREQKFSFSLTDLKTKALKRNAFVLLNKDGKPISKDIKVLELVASSEEDCEDWKATLMARGVFPDVGKSKKNKHSESTTGGSIQNQESEIANTFEVRDAHLFRQVELIRTLVESYMRIVVKTQVDVVSKMAIFLIVERLCTYVRSELIAHIYSIEDSDQLLNISESEKQRKEECFKIHKSCKQALEIINEVMNNNISSFKTETDNRSTQIKPTQSQPDQMQPFQNQSSFNPISNFDNLNFGNQQSQPSQQTNPYGMGVNMPMGDMMSSSNNSSMPNNSGIGGMYGNHMPKVSSSNAFGNMNAGSFNYNLNNANGNNNFSSGGSFVGGINNMDPFSLPSGTNNNLNISGMARKVPPRPGQK